MKYLCPIIISLLAMCSEVCAVATTSKLKVQDYTVVSDSEITIKIISKGKTEYIHVRFSPKSLAIATTLPEHKKALAHLKVLLKKGDILEIWRMSGTGYRPISGKRGHYRCDGLKLVDYRKGSIGVMFIHKDDALKSKE